MICKIHNKFFRIGKCHLCEKKEIQNKITDKEIKELETELENLDLILWEYKRK